MFAKKGLLPSGKQVVVSGEVSSAVDDLPAKESRDTPDEQSGSVWSHLLFGLVTLVVVSPMIIPGIPMNYLVVLYLSLMGLCLVSLVIWNFINARPPKH